MPAPPLMGHVTIESLLVLIGQQIFVSAQCRRLDVLQLNAVPQLPCEALTSFSMPFDRSTPVKDFILLGS